MEVSGKTVTDKLLGRFRRTGIRRTPKAGEYYWCERCIGIALAIAETAKSGVIREILEPLGNAEHLKVVKA